jgi:hypothetical protein
MAYDIYGNWVPEGGLGGPGGGTADKGELPGDTDPYEEHITVVDTPLGPDPIGNDPIFGPDTVPTTDPNDPFGGGEVPDVGEADPQPVDLGPLAPIGTYLGLNPEQLAHLEGGHAGIIYHEKGPGFWARLKHKFSWAGVKEFLDANDDGKLGWKDLGAHAMNFVKRYGIKVAAGILMAIPGGQGAAAALVAFDQAGKLIKAADKGLRETVPGFAEQQDEAAENIYQDPETGQWFWEDANGNEHGFDSNGNTTYTGLHPEDEAFLTGVAPDTDWNAFEQENMADPGETGGDDQPPTDDQGNLLDPVTGQPVIDPETGQPINVGTDPIVNPATGEPLPVDPETGFPIMPGDARQGQGGVPMTNLFNLEETLLTFELGNFASEDYLKNDAGSPQDPGFDFNWFSPDNPRGIGGPFAPAPGASYNDGQGQTHASYVNRILGIQATSGTDAANAAVEGYADYVQRILTGPPSPQDDFIVPTQDDEIDPEDQDPLGGG